MLSKVIIYRTNLQIYTLAYDHFSNLEYLLDEELYANVEAVFLAQIKQVNQETGLAFINYLGEKTGIINLNLKRATAAGSLILCQMTWAGDDSKEAKFNSQIKLVGRYVILINDNKHVFSKSLINPNRLANLSKKFLGVGLIFRSAINNLFDLSLIEKEIVLLLKQQQAIFQAISTGSTPTQLTSGTYKYMQLLRNLNYAKDLKIIVNDEEIFLQLNNYLNLWQINQLKLEPKLQLEINHIKRPKANNPLTINKDNISLIIHQLSGISLIDVNSQKSKLSFYKLNYLAVEEITKQIKLQDLTGIILIDFIKNMSKLEQQKISYKLTSLLQNDWRKNTLLGFTQAGIYEILRTK